MNTKNRKKMKSTKRREIEYIFHALNIGGSYGNREENLPLSMSCPIDIPLCPCQKQRCAWWDEDSQDCAAVVRSGSCGARTVWDKDEIKSLRSKKEKLTDE